jgi:uncharacterized protein (TIGR02145 family)
MIKLINITTLFLIITGFRVNAQIAFAAIQTGTGFTRVTTDSIILKPPMGLRGLIQWQSCDSNSTYWSNVTTYSEDKSIVVNPPIIKSYRVKITEGTCKPLFSDTIKVFPKSTTPAVYVKSGIAISDLITAGVPLSELAPTVITTDVSAITQTGATGGGNVTSQGCSVVTSRGVCWNSTGNPQITDHITTDGAGTGIYTSNVVELTANTTSYARAYATNIAGTSYGAVIKFTTSPVMEPLVVVTSDISNISQAGVTCGGSVTGTSAVITQGVCWNTTGNPTIASSYKRDSLLAHNFIISITGLNPGTKYYVRAYAVDTAGTTYGDEKTFTTIADLPAVTTTPVSNITSTTAQSGGIITSDGGSTVTVSGVCWNTTGTPTIADSKTTDVAISGSFTSLLTGLISGTIYYIRAYATNSIGTSYGNEVLFSKNGPTIVDVDGNIYDTITIGIQVWMKQNLKVTHYRNGDVIGSTYPSNLDISLQAAPKYQWAYDGMESNVATYGRLYTWFAVTDNRNLCPIGWHVPTNGEWTTLANYLGGVHLAGCKMKESLTSHWTSPNYCANNSSRFTALPGGNRSRYGSCFDIGNQGWWWSSTQDDINHTWFWSLYYGVSDAINNSCNGNYGFSVRCLKDN